MGDHVHLIMTHQNHLTPPPPTLTSQPLSGQLTMTDPWVFIQRLSKSLSFIKRGVYFVYIWYTSFKSANSNRPLHYAPMHLLISLLYLESWYLKNCMVLVYQHRLLQHDQCLPWVHFTMDMLVFFFSYSRRRNTQVSSGRCIIHSKCPIKRKSQCFQKKQLRYVFCTLQKGRKFQVLSGVASSWFIVAIRSSRPRNGEHLDKGKD